MKSLSPWQERKPERQLLLICLGGIGLGFVLVLAALHTAGRAPGLTQALPFSLYALSLAALHLALVLSGFRGDQLLVVTVAFLAGFGLLARTRLGAFPSGDGATNLADFAFLGGFITLAALSLGFKGGRFRMLAAGHAPWVWAGLSLVLLILVLITGQRFRGAIFGSGLLTPTEVVKVSFVLFASASIAAQAKALAKWHFHGLLPPWRPLLPLAGVWACLVLLLLIQRDLGMVAILGLTLTILLVLGSGHWGYAAYALGGALCLGWILVAFFEHGERRIQAWLDPFQDATGDSWQVLQGLSGMYAGGLWGDGFGAGNPEYTPIAEADFIYSVIGEELGFVGTLLVLAFFLILILRGLRISLQCRSSFGLLLGAGLTSLLAIQTFLNIGGVIKFIPLTGLTLPFISQGGSSLITTFAIVGLLLAISDGEAGRPKARAAKSGPPASPPRARKPAKTGVTPPTPGQAKQADPPGNPPGSRKSLPNDRAKAARAPDEPAS